MATPHVIVRAVEPERWGAKARLVVGWRDRVVVVVVVDMEGVWGAGGQHPADDSNRVSD